MKAIVAVDKNWGIGYRGGLLLRIPDDMKRFRKITSGGVVIMGRTTFESLPGREPLKDRVNIVLSRDKSFRNEGVAICRTIDEMFQVLEMYKNLDKFLIGGESVYRQLLPHCNEALVTRMGHEFPADKHFPNLDSEKGWELVSASDEQDYNGISFKFIGYRNSKCWYYI